MNSGRIQVDGQKVDQSYVLKSSQKISHFLHRYVFCDIGFINYQSWCLNHCKQTKSR